MLAVLKRQRFNNSESGITALIIYKCQRFDEHDNKKKQSLDKDESNSDKDKYISFPPIFFSLLPKKSQIAC